jgi:glycosyltransferase involved in cell wall biosynthesis
LKISVITVVYNRVETIADAIESVKQQRYGLVEHVIQDGGSTDGTLSVIEKTVGTSMLVRSEPDLGIYDAINRGVARATGDIIGVMHSDDIFAHAGVLSQIATIMTDPNVDGVYGDLKYVASSDLGRVIRYWRAGEYKPAKLYRGWMPPHPTLYLRREVFEKWGVYDTSFKIAADYDVMLRYLGKGNIRLSYIPEVLVLMRAGGESNRSLKQIILKTKEDLIAIRKNKMGGFGTLFMKNIRKVDQFIRKEVKNK